MALTATDAVAIYAGVVSTGSLGWQIYSWRFARKDRIEVSLSIALMGLPDGVKETVAIRVVNRSDHTVRVGGVGLDMQDGSGRQLHQARPTVGSTLPGPIESHDSAATFFSRAELEQQGFDIFKPITAWVRLATGETVWSKPTQFMHPD